MNKKNAGSFSSIRFLSLYFFRILWLWLLLILQYYRDEDVEFDLSDPGDMERKLENLSEQEIDQLLKQAYKVNKELKKELVRQERAESGKGSRGKNKPKHTASAKGMADISLWLAEISKNGAICRLTVRFIGESVRKDAQSESLSHWHFFDFVCQ